MDRKMRWKRESPVIFKIQDFFFAFIAHTLPFLYNK